MRKNNHNKESLLDNGNVADFIGKIPNPIPNWLETYLKSYDLEFPDNINEGIINGYPIDDDF